MTDKIFFQAYSPGVMLGDLVAGLASDKRAIGNAYRTLRVTPDDDVYLTFGDSSVTAVVGQGIKLRAGVIETFTAPPGATHFAWIAASLTTPTTMNTTQGEGE